MSLWVKHHALNLYKVASHENADLNEYNTRHVQNEEEEALTNSLAPCPFQPLDYEGKRAYILKVEATNIHPEPGLNPPFKDTATVKIAVEDSDEPPIFTKPVYLLEVNENAPINTVIGTVTARDPDSSGSLVR